VRLGEFGSLGTQWGSLTGVSPGHDVLGPRKDTLLERTRVKSQYKEKSPTYGVQGIFGRRGLGCSTWCEDQQGKGVPVFHTPEMNQTNRGGGEKWEAESANRIDFPMLRG